MKRIAVVLLVAVLAMSLAACGKFECDLCGEEKFGKINTGKFMGMEYEYCNDCKDNWEDMAKGVEDGLNDLADKLDDLF